jgi:hypothetical protein
MKKTLFLLLLSFFLSNFARVPVMELRGLTTGIKEEYQQFSPAIGALLAPFVKMSIALELQA